MTNTKKQTPTPSEAKSKGSKTARSRPSWLSWAAILIPVLAFATLVALDTANTPDTDADSVIGSPAPEFVLPATDGVSRDLDGYLADGEALLYFSMGPGCDGCFLQIPEIELLLEDRGISLVPVMVDPAPMVAVELERFGITSPVLIDSDRAVSDAYGMIGVYGHQDRPSHSFALVDRRGDISWVGHYAEMFVPAEQLIADLENRN